MVKRGDEIVFVDAISSIAADTTGAGDLYAAGFIYGLINKLSLEKAGYTGSLLASQVISNIGAKISADKWPGIISQVKQLHLL